MNETFNQIRQSVILIKYYNFDLNGHSIKSWMMRWSKLYPYQWLPLAITEAIYHGRLKCVSVENIMALWHKKGNIINKFNYDFINLINPQNYHLNSEEEKELKYIFNLYSFTCQNTNFLSDSEEKINVHSASFLTINGYLQNFQPEENTSKSYQKLKALVTSVPSKIILE